MKTTATPQAVAPAVTDQMIEDWKQKYGRVFCYKTADGKCAWFRSPDRRIIAASTVLAGSDNIKQKELVLKNCYLAGDAEVMDVDKYFYSLANQIDAAIEVVEGELKEV